MKKTGDNQEKDYHENTKVRKHEGRGVVLETMSFFVVSKFRAFVVAFCLRNLAGISGIHVERIN
jgi:hypothetical protein